jgi:hypothetical protein
MQVVPHRRLQPLLVYPKCVGKVFRPPQSFGHGFYDPFGQIRNSNTTPNTLGNRVEVVLHPVFIKRSRQTLNRFDPPFRKGVNDVPKAVSVFDFRNHLRRACEEKVIFSNGRMPFFIKSVLHTPPY